MMWVAICPKLGPPHACRIAALSMIRFVALRTWMSSNGGVVRFMVMYQVRSPELKWIRFFLAGCVRYCCRTGLGGWVVNEASRAPDWTLLKMSPTLVKHVATSWGTGAVAGIDTRYRKSPTAWVRWKTIVEGSGVSIPEIGVGLLALPSMPLMVPK